MVTRNHIIVDEDSEIILESCATPFNVVDGLKLKELIEKVEDVYGLKPSEVSYDKAYDTQENRGYLKKTMQGGKKIRHYDQEPRAKNVSIP